MFSLKDTGLAGHVAHFFAAHGCLSKMLTFDFFMTNVGGYQMSGKEMSENKWPTVNERLLSRYQLGFRTEPRMQDLAWLGLQQSTEYRPSL